MNLIIEGLPDFANLGKNARRRGGAWDQYRATQTETARAYVLLRQAMEGQTIEPFTRPVTIRYSVRFGDKRRGRKPDVENLAPALAPWTDALVKLGVLLDDSPRWVKAVTQCVDDSPGDAQLTIRIAEWVPDTP